MGLWRSHTLILMKLFPQKSSPTQVRSVPCLCLSAYHSSAQIQLRKSTISRFAREKWDWVCKPLQGRSLSSHQNHKRPATPNQVLSIFCPEGLPVGHAREQLCLSSGKAATG